jgi:hypothetical protein
MPQSAVPEGRGSEVGVQEHDRRAVQRTAGDNMGLLETCGNIQLFQCRNEPARRRTPLAPPLPLNAGKHRQALAHGIRPSYRQQGGTPAAVRTLLTARIGHDSVFFLRSDGARDSLPPHPFRRVG